MCWIDQPHRNSPSRSTSQTDSISRSTNQDSGKLFLPYDNSVSAISRSYPNCDISQATKKAASLRDRKHDHARVITRAYGQHCLLPTRDRGIPYRINLFMYSFSNTWKYSNHYILASLSLQNIRLFPNNAVKKEAARDTLWVVLRLQPSTGRKDSRTMDRILTSQQIRVFIHQKWCWVLNASTHGFRLFSWIDCRMLLSVYRVPSAWTTGSHKTSWALHFATREKAIGSYR